MFLAKLIGQQDCRLYVSTVNAKGVCRKRFAVKAMSGRGRKRKEWTRFVHTFLDEEFERMCHLGVKITLRLLSDIAKHSLSKPGSPVGPNDVDACSGKTSLDLKNHHFIARYREVSDIVRRKKCGNSSRSPEFEEWTHRTVAYHLGIVSRAFQSGQICEDSHFLYNLEDRNCVVEERNNVT